MYWPTLGVRAAVAGSRRLGVGVGGRGGLLAHQADRLPWQRPCGAAVSERENMFSIMDLSN